MHHAVGQRLDQASGAGRRRATRCSSRLRSVMSRMLTTIPPIGSSRWLAAISSRSIGVPSARRVRSSRRDRQPAAGHQVVEERAHRLDARASRTARRRPCPIASLDVVPEQPLGRRAHEDEPPLGADHGHHVELVARAEPGCRKRGSRSAGAGRRCVDPCGSPCRARSAGTGTRPGRRSDATRAVRAASNSAYRRPAARLGRTCVMPPASAGRPVGQPQRLEDVPLLGGTPDETFEAGWRSPG